MRGSADLTFASDDGRYRVVLNAGVVERMLAECVRATPVETGGVLAGRYSADRTTAVVTHMSGPPKDSQQGRFWLLRGVSGLRDWLEGLWKKRAAFYLGEWHFHPNSGPAPSPTDRAQMEAVSLSSRYNCPEPLLVIVGGDPVRDWVLFVGVHANGVFRTLELKSV